MPDRLPENKTETIVRIKIIVNILMPCLCKDILDITDLNQNKNIHTYKHARTQN